MKCRPSYLLLAMALLPIFSALGAQAGVPRILSISPTTGGEGSRVEINGQNFENVVMVRFGTGAATFKQLSPEKIVALVPRWASTAPIEVITTQGRGVSPVSFIVANDPRVPDGVGWKAGYVNPRPPKWEFHSVLLWGIAIADTRVPQYTSAEIEIAWTRLSCRVDGKEVILNDDSGKVRGALYDREPWFGTNRSRESMPFTYRSNAVVLRVGQSPERIWHFWSASPRPALPPGKLEGCTAKAQVRISPGALLEIGMDYWRATTGVWEGSEVNNHEAGVSNWYFSSPEWQEVVFTDIGGPQF